jgi:hypothetical protein
MDPAAPVPSEGLNTKHDPPEIYKHLALVDESLLCGSLPEPW